MEEIFTSHQSTLVSQPSHNGFRPFYIDMAGPACPNGFPADPALGCYSIRAYRTSPFVEVLGAQQSILRVPVLASNARPTASTIADRDTLILLAMAHALIEGPPNRTSRDGDGEARALHLLCISKRTPGARRMLVDFNLSRHAFDAA